MLRFVAIYALFGRLLAKKCCFGSKAVFLGQEVHYYIVYIAYYTEQNVQIFNYAEKHRICCKLAKTRLTKELKAFFASAESLATSATLNVTNDEQCMNKGAGQKNGWLWRAVSPERFSCQQSTNQRFHPARLQPGKISVLFCSSISSFRERWKLYQSSC